METISLTLDGTRYSERLGLAGTVFDFLQQAGFEHPPEIVLDTQGRRVATAYTLVHTIPNAQLRTESPMDTVPALVADELLIRA